MEKNEELRKLIRESVHSLMENSPEIFERPVPNEVHEIPEINKEITNEIEEEKPKLPFYPLVKQTESKFG